MDIIIPIISVILSGIISFVVSMLTINAQKQKLERELERKLTEKLYDRRMEAYPKAFTITQEIPENNDLCEKTATKIQKDLSEWQANDAAFILSGKSRKAYYNLRNALKAKPDANGCAKCLRMARWDAKNEFRKSLRNDVRLLFLEDEKSQDDTESQNEASNTKETDEKSEANTKPQREDSQQCQDSDG